MSQAALDQIKALNHAYHMITGENAYLYTSDSGVSFVTAVRPFTNTGDALTHMQDVLSKAQAGWTHHEIMYGRSNGIVNPYPNAPRVNRGAW